MSNFLKIAFNLLDYWILILTMQYVCAGWMNLSKRNVAVGSCLSVMGTTAAFFCPYNLEYVIGMVVVVAVSVCLFSSKRLSDLLRFFPAFFIYYFLAVVPVALVQEIAGPVNIQLVQQDGLREIMKYAPDITLLVLLLILRHVQVKYRLKVHFSLREILGSIAMLFFSIIDGAFIIMLNRGQYEPVWYYIYMFIFVGGYCAGVGYFVYCLIESRVRIYRQTFASCETEYLRMQLDSLKEVKENEAEVRKLRHDLKNHLAVLSSLCAEGEYEEVKKYTEQLGREALHSDIKIPTGNQVADQVVASKRRICEEGGIAFTFSGTMKNLDALTAPDICGLLANAYDNAIEACRVYQAGQAVSQSQQPEAYIRTQVSTTRNYTVIEIANPVWKAVPIRGNRVSTSKKDKKAHGYGIEIMKQIAERYNGSCTVRCDGKEFQVKIVLLT